MGLDFTKPAASPAPAEQNTATPAVQEETYPQYNIVADRQQMDQTLTGSQEVDELASKIEVYNLETIVSFGAEAADEDLQVLRRDPQLHGHEPAGQLQRHAQHPGQDHG